MTTFADFKPKGGMRNPRIFYRVDDPRMAPLEEMRRLGGPGSMNALYLEALLIGAATILSRESVVLPVLRARTPPELHADARRSSPHLERTGAANSSEDASSVGRANLKSVSVPPLPVPRIGRPGGSPAAAAAQFARFGDMD